MTRDEMPLRERLRAIEAVLWPEPHGATPRDEMSAALATMEQEYRRWATQVPHHTIFHTARADALAEAQRVISHHAMVVRALPSVVAQLRHAYQQLHGNHVKDDEAFADGLIAPQIHTLEQVLRVLTNPSPEIP